MKVELGDKIEMLATGRYATTDYHGTIGIIKNIDEARIFLYILDTPVLNLTNNKLWFNISEDYWSFIKIDNDWDD